MVSEQDLIHIDRKLFEADKKLLFHYINPINEDEEKKKFFADPSYQPQFRYQPLLFNPLYLREDLQALSFGQSRAEVVFKKKAESLYQFLHLLAHRGKPEFTKYSVALYGQPSPQLLRLARLYVSQKTHPVKEGELSAKEVIALFKAAFFRYGFQWDVKEKSMPARAYVSTQEKVLYLQKGASFTKSSVKKLIVHEVGTHMLRAENGEKQPYHIFSTGLAGYLMTEEGLAVYNEEENHVTTKHELKMYAARVLAIHLALKSGFRETFNELCQHFPKDVAWKITVRSKRGLGDTSRPGAFTKDLLYLKGHLAVRNYVRNGGNLEALYYGKVGIHDVEYLKDIPGLLHPRFMPLFQYFDFFLKALESKLLLDIKFITRPFLTPFELTREGLKKILGGIK